MLFRRSKTFSDVSSFDAITENHMIENRRIANIETILEDLDMKQSKEHETRRHDTRFRYRVMDGIGMDILPRMQGAKRRTIFPRNLSRRGIAFIHKGIVYPDSEYMMWLVATSGEIFGVPGKTMWLRPVGDGVIEVGLRFQKSIEIDRFITHAAAQAA